MKNKVLVFLGLCLAFSGLQAQVEGGRYVYEFLELSPSARATALGGRLPSVRDKDLSLSFLNPAALNAENHNNVSLQQNAHISGITHGTVAYAYHIAPKKLSLMGSIEHVSYGQFEGYDEVGQATGSFSASELALGLGASYQASDKWSFGLQVKGVFSRYEAYSSRGWAANLGMIYQDTAKRFSMGFVLKNIGQQLKSYHPDQEKYALPFDMQLGLSQQLKYLPLRISVVAHHLDRWDIRYEDPALVQENSLLGTEEPQNNDFGEGVDNFFRHLNFNLEFLLGPSLRLRLGYDHLRQREMSIENLRSLAGFSAGIGFKLYKFRFDYGLANYHLAGTVHHFGVSTRLQDF